MIRASLPIFQAPSLAGSTPMEWRKVVHWVYNVQRDLPWDTSAVLPSVMFPSGVALKRAIKPTPHLRECRLHSTLSSCLSFSRSHGALESSLSSSFVRFKQWRCPPPRSTNETVCHFHLLEYSRRSSRACLTLSPLQDIIQPPDTGTCEQRAVARIEKDLP